MEFEWDEEKNRANKAKHGISFGAAIEVFEDPNELTDFDQHIDGEDRWTTLGIASGATIVLVVHTDRTRGGIEIIRIISARGATKDEKKRYERQGRKNR
ncbi:MAG TPA: BrnT family toxin [Arsenicitalea sp.]|jgi:hypothetical protein|nr:BrnT family toxin [Arsenicitalea sp.]